MANGTGMPGQVVKCSKMATGTGLKKAARVALAFAVAGIARGGTEGITTGVELRCLRSSFFDFRALCRNLWRLNHSAERHVSYDA